jgi:uncharacterized spore protein YtfJ
MGFYNYLIACSAHFNKVLPAILKFRRKDMETVENLVKATLGEIEKVLTTRTVVGEPINVQGRTLIPIVSVGFGFGAGAGEGKGGERRMGDGSGGGAGGGGWVRPMAIVIIDKDGVKVEGIRGGLASAVEKMAEMIPTAIEKGIEAKDRMKKEGTG